MKRLLTAVLMTLYFSTIFADDMVDYLYSKKVIFQKQYTIDSAAHPIIVRLDFNSDSILNPKVAAILKSTTAERIDFVFTNYAASASFDQPKLNIARLNALKAIAPRLFTNTLTQWNFIAQTKASCKEDASEMLHAFVIYPTPPASKATVAIDKKRMKYFFETLSTVDTCTDTVLKIKFKYVETGLYKHRNYVNQKNIKLSPIKSKKYPYALKKQVVDSSYVVVPVRCASYAIDYRPFILNNDSVVMAVLDRKKEWKNKIVVTDVTGSMSPYTTQLLLWYKLHETEEDVNQFVFFNDGNMKPDDKKVIGATGGIYSCEGKAGYDYMAKQVSKAMQAGCGGDAPENNMEALLSLRHLTPEQNVVMIADNFAPVKDLELLLKFKFPVKIILCGVRSYINSDYLDIARYTGGSIHTMESDIENLMLLKEGDSITINKMKYKISGGKFVLAL
ncbi:MAG: hypothetical protein U0T32_12360 [Chitinophagales bacterium]